ncbi:MAG: DUF7309 domain-containing protein [Bacteroidota bacterium]
MSEQTDINKNWKRVYDAASKIYGLKPWQWMKETDIFGIKIPGTTRNYFISVMGSLGEVTAITAYKGERALQMFWRLQEEDTGYLSSSFAAACRIFTIPQIMLDFVEEENLEPEEIERIKSSGGKTVEDKIWPVLDHYVPGFMPDAPDGKALDDAAIILEQCPHVFEKAREDENFLYPGDDMENHYLMRLIKEESGTEWKDAYKEVWAEPLTYNVRFPSFLLPQVKKRQKKQETVQIDLVMLPSPVKEGDIKPYYPFVLLVINKKTGIIQDFKMLTPLPDLDTMYESIPEKLLDMFLEGNSVPAEVEMRSDVLISLMEQLFDKAGIVLKRPSQMKVTDEAIEGMISHMGDR